MCIVSVISHANIVYFYIYFYKYVLNLFSWSKETFSNVTFYLFLTTVPDENLNPFICTVFRSYNTWPILALSNAEGLERLDYKQSLSYSFICNFSVRNPYFLSPLKKDFFPSRSVNIYFSRRTFRAFIFAYFV
jgi:hypothetical protein